MTNLSIIVDFFKQKLEECKKSVFELSSEQRNIFLLSLGERFLIYLSELNFKERIQEIDHIQDRFKQLWDRDDPNNLYDEIIHNQIVDIAHSINKEENSIHLTADLARRGLYLIFKEFVESKDTQINEIFDIIVSLFDQIHDREVSSYGIPVSQLDEFSNLFYSRELQKIEYDLDLIQSTETTSELVHKIHNHSRLYVEDFKELLVEFF